MVQQIPVAVFGCRKYPQLQIRELVFHNSVLTVYSEEDAELVRGNDGFGIFIEELKLDQKHDIEPEVSSEGRARVGMRSAGDPNELRQEDEPKIPALDTPQYDSVLAKPGGWYEYQGKNYRKADLPVEVQGLI